MVKKFAKIFHLLVPFFTPDPNSAFVSVAFLSRFYSGLVTANLSARLFNLISEILLP